MSVIKLVRSLLKKPMMDAVPLPNDWPPEGSVHFIDVTQAHQKLVQEYGYKPIPANFKIYEFGLNWAEEDWAEERFGVVPLAIEIMKRLCEGRAVLTDIVSTLETFTKKKYTRQERFTVRYHRFLEKAYPDVSAYMENERKLDILTTGLHSDSLFAYEELDTTDHCYFEFYLFSEERAPQTAQRAWSMVQKNEYDIQLWINDSPIALEVIFNPGTVDIDFIHAVVKNLCEKDRIQLSNPPEKN